MIEIIYIAFFYLAASILVGAWGHSRNVGFKWPFVASILLSPIIGAAVVLIRTPPNGRPKSPMRAAFDEARRLEIHGRLPEALEKYRDALFEVENASMSPAAKRRNTEIITKRIRSIQ